MTKITCCSRKPVISNTEYIKKIDTKYVFMREDMGLCTYEKHHKQKIVLFLSAMRSYRDELRKRIRLKFYIKLSENTKLT